MVLQEPHSHYLFPLPSPDIWQCVEVTWHKPRKSIVPVSGLMDFIRVQGPMETTRPSVPPLMTHFSVVGELTLEHAYPPVCERISIKGVCVIVLF